MATKFYRFVDTMDIREAVAVLLHENLMGAPVVDKEGALVGMLSELDCLSLLTHGSEMPQGSVRNFMTTTIETVEQGMDIFYVAGKFLTAHFRSFPVLKDGALVGLISRTDILRAIQISAEQERIRETAYEQQGPS